jgi:hypothetical protein
VKRSRGKNAGTQEQITVSRNARDAHGSKQAHTELNDSQHKHGKANRPFGTIQPIDAELTIVGNPTYDKYIKMTEFPRACSIVAINPFHISSAFAGCGEWLANPGCNEVLSNKNWLVHSINHSIQAGTYHTTMKVSLPAPGLDVESGAPLGGPGSNGYVPKNSC